MPAACCLHLFNHPAFQMRQQCNLPGLPPPAVRRGDTVLVDCGHEDTMRIDRQLVLPTGRKEWR